MVHTWYFFVPLFFSKFEKYGKDRNSEDDIIPAAKRRQGISRSKLSKEAGVRGLEHGYPN